MNCELVISDLALYFYGELTDDAEERVEQHCSKCENCRCEMERFRKLAKLLDQRDLQIPAGLMGQCRGDLTWSLRQERAAREPAHGWPSSWQEMVHALLHSSVAMRVPLGAIALVALGFFGARLSNSVPNRPASDGILNVRSVQADASGRVQIQVDDTQRRVISGKLDDPRVRQLLLSAVSEQSEAGVRVEGVDLLKNLAGSADVRPVLVESLQHDPNPGVRLRALEGLKPYAADPLVKKALAEVLRNDANPGVRIQVIDLLVAHRDDSMVGVMQNMVRKEDNTYVRWKLRNALEQMNASVGTY